MGIQQTIGRQGRVEPAVHLSPQPLLAGDGTHLEHGVGGLPAVGTRELDRGYAQGKY